MATHKLIEYKVKNLNGISLYQEINKTLEIKNDLMAQKTNNLAIELYKKNGDASGIMISEADYWVVFAINEIFMFSRLALRQYCEENIQHRIVWGGDRWETQMVLIPIDEIRRQDFFRKIG